MDQKTNQLQTELGQFFDDIASSNNLSDEQKKELFTKLEGAIIINIVGKMFDQLSGPDKQIIKEQEFKNSEDLFKFLSRVVPEDVSRNIISLSVTEVVEKFLEKL